MLHRDGRLKIALAEARVPVPFRRTWRSVGAAHARLQRCAQ